jgi:enoyl-CoA hydratase
VITREDSGEIAVVRMAHGKVSALDTGFCDALVREIDTIAAGSAKALVLTGTGTTFSAGVDLFQVLNGGADYLAKFLPAMQRLFRALLTFPKPAVAAVNGHAIAGGCIIAAACDHRVMADGSGRIGVPELVVGVPFPTLPFEIVLARVSHAAFRRLVYFGSTVLPHQAVELGLVDEIAPADVLIARAREIAQQLACIPAVTFALTKRTFTASLLDRVSASASLDADVVVAWRSPDVQNRIKEYVEETIKRSR